MRFSGNGLPDMGITQIRTVRTNLPLRLPVRRRHAKRRILHLLHAGGPVLDSIGCGVIA